MSNIIELFNDFKTEAERQAYLNKQFETISMLLQENTSLKAEVEHLKHLLNASVPSLEPQVEQIIVSREEALVDAQIFMLQQVYMKSEMSLDDTKKLDLLLKNKKIFRDEKGLLSGKPAKKPRSLLSKDQLLTLAATPIKEDENG